MLQMPYGNAAEGARRLWQGIARAFALSMNTWLFVCVFCLALMPLLAFAHIQNTTHRQTANRSGPNLPGLCCAPVVCLSPSSLRYRHAA